MQITERAKYLIQTTKLELYLSKFNCLTKSSAANMTRFNLIFCLLYSLFYIYCVPMTLLPLSFSILNPKVTKKVLLEIFC